MSFLKLQPPRFNGTIGEDRQDFLFTLEHYFDALNYTDNSERVRYAAFLLSGRAMVWWHDLERKGNISWEEFKNELILFVLPRSIRNKKVDEFNDFHQEEGMYVSEYEEKFRDLSRYAPEGCRTETALASKFQQGLLPGYARLIAALGLKTVGKIVEATRAIE